ncbi:RNA polymerase sigma factor [Kitasatospora sp. NPDC059646]|uniref:RNA polymerase sigma factor n=1 Tax=Kitasatospora sp. NPDC059646 TaxID=3346893 RepID=UPI0036CC5BC7
MRARLRAGEPAAFAELFDDHARSVYNHAFRLTADRSTAEDVMSATFLEAWRLRDRIDAEGGSLRPWLLGIATNTARNHVRSNRLYRRAVLATAAAELSVPDHAEEVTARLDERRELAAALRVLGRLRPAEREIVALCLGEGLDYETAAQALGIPVGTVASRLSRARKKLRTLTAAELEGKAAAAGAPPGPDARRRRTAPTASAARPEKTRLEREVTAHRRQVPGDRTTAVRPAQEGHR